MKNIRFSVGVKLLSAFAFFSIIIIVSGLVLFFTLKQYKEGIVEYEENYSPSMTLLNEISNNISKSNELILIWIYVEKKRNTKSKNTLDNIVSYRIPDFLLKIKKYTKLWTKKERKQFLEINKKISTLLEIENKIMLQLETNSDYNYKNLTKIKNKLGTDKELTKLSAQTIKELNSLSASLKSEFASKQHDLKELYIETRDTLFFRAILLLIVSIIIAVLTANRIIKPIRKIRLFVMKMSKGILSTEEILVQNDEIGDISEAISTLSRGLNETANFSIEIGKGNFEVDYKPLGAEDILGNSLLSTKENLLKTENFRKKNTEQERQRNWMASGIANFSEILRDNNDIEKLSYLLVRELVKYLEINQGAFFLVNEIEKENIYLELKAAYAYEYKTEKEKNIKAGESLIGQCFVEKETIYMNKVPNNYLKISSGLGEEKPASVLIVPLKRENKVFGVLELASFFEFEKHKIQFVEKISESIAGTIYNIETNEHTAKLLDDSQALASQLSAQDEETQQIMEEMQASQEELESSRKIEKEKEQKLKEEYLAEIKELKTGLEGQIKVIDEQKIKLQNTFNAINHSLGTAHFTLKGKFIKVNNMFLEMTGIKEEQLIGMKLVDFMRKDIVESDTFVNFWDNLNNGNSQSGGHQYFYNNKEVWLYETFTPVKNDAGEFYKIIALCNDISKVRKNENSQNQKIEELEIENQILELQKKTKTSKG